MIDNPFDTAALVLGAGATFVARTLDNDQKHLQAVLHRAASHKGTSFVEILQNCPIFNDGAFDAVAGGGDDNEHRRLFLEHGQPMTFGPDSDRRGLVLRRGLVPEVVRVAEADPSELLVHDESSDAVAFFLAGLRWQGAGEGQTTFPVPLGVLRAVEHPSYERSIHAQLAAAREKRGVGDFDDLFASGDTWVVD